MCKFHVEIFNSDQFPNSSDLCNAAAHRCNAIIITPCVTAFVQIIESGLSSVPFLDEQEFANTHVAAKEQALTLFQKSQKMGDSQIIDAAESDLKNKLDEKISFFMAVNQSKRADDWKTLEQKLKKILSE